MKNLIILSLMATLFTGCATSRIEGWKRLIGGKVTSKKELRAELKKWTIVQGDDLLPHQEPYLTKHPIPEIIRPPKKK